jgi:hypothetical protein
VHKTPLRSEPEPKVSSVLEGDLKLAIKNDLSELKNATAALAQFLDAHHVPHRAAYAVNVAVDELVVNVIVNQTGSRVGASRRDHVFRADSSKADFGG